MKEQMNYLELKRIYSEMKKQNFRTREDVLKFVKKSEDIPYVKCIKYDEYVMEKDGKIYTCCWSDRYPVMMIVEDIVRGTQVLNDLKIDGTYNTLSLIGKLES